MSKDIVTGCSKTRVDIYMSNSKKSIKVMTWFKSLRKKNLFQINVTKKRYDKFIREEYQDRLHKILNKGIRIMQNNVGQT